MQHDQECDLYPATGRFLLGRGRSTLSDGQKRALEDAVCSIENRNHGERIISTGEACKVSTMLIEGFMARTLDTDGGRCAVSFHVPGDFVDLHCFALGRLDHNIDCLGPVKVGFVSHDALRDIVATDPSMARKLWFSTLLDAAIHREWIMKLEQLTTPRRLAHIFAEIWARLDMVGLGRSDGFDTPLTQSDLAEMSGSSKIHVNRAIGKLREEGIAEFRRGRAHVKDRAALHRYCDFDPGYLYGNEHPPQQRR